MIPLDNFARIRQNKKVNTFNQLEAWMTFLSTDEPEMWTYVNTLDKKS